MKNFYSRSARLYLEDGTWLANCTEAVGEDGRGHLDIDMINTAYEENFADFVIKPRHMPQVNMRAYPEDTIKNPVDREHDYVLLQNIRMIGVQRFYGHRVRLSNCTMSFTYDNYELNLFADLTLDKLEAEYDVD